MNGSVIIQIDNVDVPIVFVASAGRLRWVDNACVVIETETETRGEIL